MTAVLHTGRVVATFNPALASHDNGWTVHFQPHDGGTSGGCSPLNSGEFLYPFKMRVPGLRARIEQRDLGPGLRDQRTRVHDA